MADNDIKKALECCKRTCVNRCDGCPYRERLMCALDLRKDSLDLINRQQAEIERLQAMVQTLAECRDNDLKEGAKAVRKAKSEAVKEFAELVKMEFYKEFDELIPSIMADKIDNLVKEMTEQSVNYGSSKTGQ